MTTEMTANPDRLYELLPAIYRMRDVQQGYPLQALLRVIAEQVTLVEEDISQLYENWFIETCQDWVVPYLGSAVGYQPAVDFGQSQKDTSRAQIRESILIPRREVSNTIAFRQKKGTLQLLNDLAAAVGGWPALAVEFFRFAGVTQNVNFVRLHRGKTVDVRRGRALRALKTPFDHSGHTVDVRRAGSQRTAGKTNIDNVGVYVWRLAPYSVMQSPAYCYEEEGQNCFLFSALGNDTALYNNPQPQESAASGKINFPEPISRLDLEKSQRLKEVKPSPPGLPRYYGDGKSFEIWTGNPRKLFPAENIVAADLSDWTYRPLPDYLAVDPELGRFAFAPGQIRRGGVWVSYYYGFSANIGGGEYERTDTELPNSKLYVVGPKPNFSRINDALTQWRADAPQTATIQIADSNVYAEPINITLGKGQTLKISAAPMTRPIIRLLDWQTSESDSLTITGEGGGWFIVDGLLITGRGVQVTGDVAGVLINHSTLVPGWGLKPNCEPQRPTEASLELIDAPGCLRIEHSIVGAIQVERNERTEDPLEIHISDSIVDATRVKGIALGAPESLCAFANLTILRSTVFGEVQTHAVELAENSIFMGLLRVCRRRKGCIRFCYVSPGSQTTRRYECQPDLVVKAVTDLFSTGKITPVQRDVLLQREKLRVEPEFASAMYGNARYARLSDTCAVEIRTGADDKSEMGVFHDLYEPLREANLRTRLSQFTPANTDAGIFFAS